MTADLHLALIEYFLGELIDVIVLVHNFSDPCIDQDLGAHDTGEICGVNNRVFDTDTKVSGLYDCILLCVDATAEFMTGSRLDVIFHPNTADLGAMLEALGRAIITSGEYTLLLDHNCPNIASQAG